MNGMSKGVPAEETRILPAPEMRVTAQSTGNPSNEYAGINRSHTGRHALGKIIFSLY